MTKNPYNGCELKQEEAVSMKLSRFSETSMSKKCCKNKVYGISDNIHCLKPQT